MNLRKLKQIQQVSIFKGIIARKRVLYLRSLFARNLAVEMAMENLVASAFMTPEQRLERIAQKLANTYTSRMPLRSDGL
jgi:hypothetical protein